MVSHQYIALFTSPFQPSITVFSYSLESNNRKTSKESTKPFPPVIISPDKMSKAVVYTLLTTAFIVLVILSLAIITTHKDYRPRGLSRRLGFKIPPPLFDPLVIKMERIAEEKGLDDRDLPTNWETSTLAKENSLIFLETKRISDGVYESKNFSTARNGMGHGEAGWWKEQFKNADIDHNGILNFNEFKE